HCRLRCGLRPNHAKFLAYCYGDLFGDLLLKQASIGSLGERNQRQPGETVQSYVMPDDPLAVASNDLDVGGFKKVSLEIKRGQARNIDRRNRCDWLPFLALGGSPWRLWRRGCTRKIESRRRHLSFRFRQPGCDYFSVVQGKAGDYIGMNFTLQVKRLIESIE